jgi:hypothetical protein
VTANPGGPARGGPGGPVGPGKPGKGTGQRAVSVIGPGAGQLTAAQRHAITAGIDAQPGTLHYLTETDDNLEFPGLAITDGGVQLTAYGDGDPAWSNRVLIYGAWYAQSSAVPQIDVNTLFLTDTSTAVGDMYTMVNGTRKVTAKIVGAVFDRATT